MTAQIGGVLEASLYVEDLERSAEFYERVFGFETLVPGSRMRALGVCGRQVLLLFRRGATSEPVPTPGGLIPGHGGAGRLHLAFAIAAADLEAWRKRLAGQGVAVESEVRWPRGGRSLYFRDPDGHSVELVTPGCWSIY